MQVEDDGSMVTATRECLTEGIVPSWRVLRAALIRIGEKEIANRIAVSGYNY